MSIALERGGGGIGRTGFIGGTFGTYNESPPEEAESCSSSIGRNSDSSGGGSDGGDESEEVQSSLKGPLDTMDALEDSLPIRRGISKFYCGKSKSFTSLADAQRSSSAKDLAKPESSYNRKRKSLLAFSTLMDKTCSNSLRKDEDAAVYKRPANSSRTTVGHGHPESSSSGSNSNSSGSTEENHGHSRQLPPLHPHGKLTAQNCSSPVRRRPSAFQMRSFSLTDLEGAANATSSIVSGAKQKLFH